MSLQRLSLQLKLFGGLSLVDSSSNATRVTRRHRLAVLAVLAASDRPVPRERLLALIWPDSNDEAARHSLGQVLYGLKQDVALGELVTGATDLSLDRSHIDCDLWTFREALKTGDKRGAIAIYSGPFLDGFQLPNADGFDRWCDEERRAIARTVADTIEALAAEATSKNEFAEAASWWRRLAGSDPLSSRVALNYMRALVAAGDRAAAVQHARVHAALVRAELEVDADASLLAYAEELKAAAPASAVASPTTPTTASAVASPTTAATAPTAASTNADASTQTAAQPAHQLAALEVPTTETSHRGRTTRRSWWIALTAVAAVAITGFGIVRARAKSANTIAEINGIPVVAVLPFDVRGDTTRAFLGEALPALLTGRLDAPGVLRTLESNAVLSAIGKRASGQNLDVAQSQSRVGKLGANLFVTGTVVVLGDRLEINAELRGPNEAPSRAVRANVVGPADSLFVLADQLGAKLLVEREGRALGNSALGGTSSVPALKSLLAGERALREWQLFDAIAAYQASLAIDSTYAFAWYRLAFVQGWADGGGGRDAMRHAVQLSAHLPERYALLIAAISERAQNNVQAEHDFLTLVQRYPDDADAWAELGEYRMHVAPLYGQPTTNAEAPLARTLALDSLGHPEVRLHLSQLAFEKGDVAAARNIIAPLLARGNRSDRIVRGFRLSLALALGPTTDSSIQDAATLVREFRDEPAPGLNRSLLLNAGSVGVTQTAYALAESLTTSASSRQHQAAALAVLMQFDAARSEWESVRRRASALTAIDSLAAAESWGILAQVPAVVMSNDIWNSAGELLERSALRDTSNAATNRMVLSALLAVRGANSAAFARRLNSVAARKHFSTEDSAIVHGLRAIHAQAVGDTVTETRELQNLAGPVNVQWVRWARARWLERTGKRDEAERWYLSVPWGPWSALMRGRVLDEAARLELARGNKIEADKFSKRAKAFAFGDAERK